MCFPTHMYKVWCLSQMGVSPWCYIYTHSVFKSVLLNTLTWHTCIVFKHTLCLYTHVSHTVCVCVYYCHIDMCMCDTCVCVRYCVLLMCLHTHCVFMCWRCLTPHTVYMSRHSVCLTHTHFVLTFNSVYVLSYRHMCVYVCIVYIYVSPYTHMYCVFKSVF